MTIDRFVEDRRARWGRLGQLVFRARGRVDRLSADEVLELGQLYRTTTSDLAIARRDFPRDVATERLNDLVAAAHALVYSEAPTSGRRLRRFLFGELPATVRAQLPWTGVAFGLFMAFAIATYAIGIAFPEIAQSALPDDVRQQLARRNLWTNIPEGYRPIAGPLIIVNNVRVAIVMFAGGMTAGALTVYGLAANGAMIGTIFAVVQSYGLAGGLLAFIAGHGFLELSSIFLSGGAGLRLAWAILRPGERSRRDALKLAAAQAGRVIMLVIPVLGVAGVIEAFLSPSGVSDYVKAAVGLVTGAMLWGYILFAGRRSTAAVS
ncbi:MAG TPA: stage II sporulation protein M [Candidatus Limnocylindria bacterium]|nr:stage II sporulation protein M [Candidatus Limnocylindria bacterium]